MSCLKAVGFDLDGTLFDHHGSATQAVDALVRTLGVEPSAQVRQLWFETEDAEFERWRLGEVTFQEQRRSRLRTVMRALGLSPSKSENELDSLFAQYVATARSAWQPFSDSADVLIDLRRRGFTLGVLTNGSEAQQVDKLKTTGLYDLVDVVCTSEALGVQKPDPLAFSTLAERLGVLPTECLFVGDHPEHDIAGARAAGMDAVLIDRLAVDGAGLADTVEGAFARHDRKILPD